MLTFHPSRFAAAIALAALGALLLPGTLMAAEKYKGYERGDLLITAQELKQLIDAKDPKLVILAVANTAEYRLPGHIPGAIRVWRPDYEIAVGRKYPFEGMMLERADFEAFARKFGISNDTKLVIYDHQYDATRLWWGFFLYGKTARVLDGGFQAWKAAGYDTDTLAPSDPKPGTFTAAEPNPRLTAVMTDVYRAEKDANIQLWDTREKSEWTGEELKKGAFRKGRIPWAKFFNWKELKKPVVDGEKFTEFKPAAEVQQVLAKFGVDPKKEQIFYCQSAVRTTTHIFTMYMLGWDINQLRNYDGSWIEWSYYEKNPVVVDAAGTQ
jgi:thiosulfate/3-mercaptopyruvate sulfurtransferase